MINGPSADGLPPLPPTVNENDWRKAFQAEFQVAPKMVEQGYNILIDDYGLTKESESLLLQANCSFSCHMLWQISSERF